MEQPFKRHTQRYTVAQKELRLALLNATKLILSLIGTISVAMFVRIMVPRFLGPELFGKISYSEAFAATLFAFAGFGVDTYIRKEVSTNLKHAQDFYAGFFMVRMLTCLGLLLGFGIWGHFYISDGTVYYLCLLYSLGQIAFIDNYTLSAMLQAASQVNELSLVNIASKLIWGFGVMLTLLWHASILWVAVSFATGELFKSLYLFYVVHQKFKLNFAVHIQPTLMVMWLSFPYFINNLALSIYEKLNVLLIHYFVSHEEVGWYGSALNIAGFSLLFLPVLQAVLMPMAARTAKISTAAMNEVMQQGAQLTLVLGACLSLCLALNADVIVHLVFGAKYAPAGMDLKILAPMFTLTYFATVCSLHLIQQNRIWLLIAVSVFNVLVNPIINIPLIFLGKTMGLGMAGAMSGLATVLSEFFTVMILLWRLGDAQCTKALGYKIIITLLICAVVFALHPWYAQLGLASVLVDAGLYMGLAFGLSTLPWPKPQQILANLTQKHE